MILTNAKRQLVETIKSEIETGSELTIAECTGNSKSLSRLSLADEYDLPGVSAKIDP